MAKQFHCDQALPRQKSIKWDLPQDRARSTGRTRRRSNDNARSSVASTQIYNDASNGSRRHMESLKRTNLESSSRREREMMERWSNSDLSIDLKPTTKGALREPRYSGPTKPSRVGPHTSAKSVASVGTASTKSMSSYGSREARYY
eukprot:CAMPEP_0118708600 /NCGR_PEP_ID=MMETSP0800-20121206/22008_1 /TAXON_ID=210618 ORGANISM="Striatella unipunctata, Strain CCMP2910" /NCGR_SAMPLE_ID=MMETSP0800 /ASSEMBLY_ACC=CAM_ASM_000638 /LENGTH=145 /DNA_ID=CAMNT_0006611873 /DNA_START=325 /DNA_END=762 /DNA_ORIENTATION=-